MRFGIGPLTCQSPSQSTMGMPDVYENTIQLVERAERAGFDSAWVTEHHFWDDGYLPSPLTMAAALAARTTSMEVGTGIATAPLYEPLRLAEDTAVISNVAAATGGRFTLGLGLGYQDVEYEGFRAPKRERVGRLLDAVDTCRSAWSPGALDVDGRLVDYPAVDVTPKPVREPKILFGPVAEPSIRRTARVADGYLSPLHLTVEAFDEALDLLADVLVEEDRDPGEFDVHLLRYAFVHEDGAEAAWDAMRDSYVAMRTKYLRHSNESTDLDLNLSDEQIDAQIDEFVETWRSWAVYGAPEDVVAELERYADCWDHEISVITQLHYPEMAFETAERAVDLFGAEVIPALRER